MYVLHNSLSRECELLNILSMFSSQEAKHAELMKQKGVLEAQRVELRSKNATAAEASKGTVGAEFFGNFGSSVR